MAYDRAGKLRCDHCQKWVPECSLSTLPDELYPMLNADNEFGICLKCHAKHDDLEYWREWVKEQYAQGKGLKVE